MEAEWCKSAKVKEHGRIEVIIPALQEGDSVQVTVRRETPETVEKKPLVFGSARGMIISISDDFDEPLEDFKEYM